MTSAELPSKEPQPLANPPRTESVGDSRQADDDQTAKLYPERVLRARTGWVALDLGELWRFRELLGLLTLRDVLIRYKQTYLGVAWAVLQPLLTTLVLVFVFRRIAKLDSGGAPYELVCLSALVPWNFFSNALSESSNSLVASARIITKVYFPRLIIPLSSVLSGVVDAAIGLAILGVFMAWFGVAPTPLILLAPLFLILMALVACAAGVWLSALNVQYRDVRYVVPFITRIGMYAAPVAYTSVKIPEHLQPFFCSIPFVGPMEGFRWAILGSGFEPHWGGLAVGAVITAVVLFAGLAYFRRVEKQFADII
jgi:lipopolysaccharide transport system permease protein